MEVCVGVGIIFGAGECNGFLKTRDRLLSPSLRFEDGHVLLDTGFRPTITWAEHSHLVTQHVAFSWSPQREHRMDELAGQVGVVNGSARNIGRAIAEALARAGAAVIVNARSSKTEVDEVAAGIVRVILMMAVAT